MTRPTNDPGAGGARQRIAATSAAVLALWLAGIEQADATVNPEAVGKPAPNRVWAGCALSLNTVNAIKSALDQGNIDTPDLSFVVVYSRTKPNHGQPLTAAGGGGTTGPVICIPQSDLGVAIEKTTEEENIPTAEDQGGGVANVDLLDIASVLTERFRYLPTSGTTFENRFCHTVSNPATSEPGNPPPTSNTNCFRISTAAVDEPVGSPLANRVWAGCTLGTTTADDIRTAVQAGYKIDDPNVEVSYIVVYSNNNANNGQPLTTGGATGPVICTAPGVLIEKTTESEDMPNGSDQPGVNSVDLLDISEALAIRYSYGTPTKRESRFCHSVANAGTGASGNPPLETNTDCFRVFSP